MSRVGWVLLLCLLCPAARGEDSAAITVVREFYGHLSGGNVRAAGALWADAQRPWFERSYARIAAIRCMRLESLALQSGAVGSQPTEALGTLSIDADATIAEWHAGAKSERLSRRQSRFRLRRERDAWRIEEWVEKEQAVADAIMRAATDADREALLREHADLSGFTLGEALTKRAVTLANERRLADAAAVNGIARRIAEDHLDDRLLSRVLGVESVLARLPEPPDLAASVALAEESVRLAEASGDPDTLQQALLRMIRARRLTGDPTELLRRALDLAGHVEDLTTAAHVATQAAWYYDDTLEHRQALIQSLRAEALAEASGDPTARLNAQLNLGGAYLYRGDYALAEKHYERALAIARERKFPGIVASALERLAVARFGVGDDRRALLHLEEMLEIARANESPGAIADALVVRGRHAMWSRNFAAAEADLTAAVAAAKQANRWNSLRSAEEALASLRYDQGRHEEALRIAQSPLLKALARIALGRFAEAEPYVREAIEDFDKSRAAIGVDPRQVHRIISSAFTSNTLVDLLIECGRVEEGLEELERRKSALLRDVLAQAGAADLTPLTVEERKRLSATEERLARLNRARAAGDFASLRGEIVEARLELSELWARIRVLHPELDAASVTSPAYANGETPGLDVVYVSYVVMNEKTIVLAVSRDERGATRVRTAPIPVALTELRARVRRFVEQVESRDLGFAANARALYDLLLRPVESELFRPGRRICIIPDDELWRLPFHALKPSATSFVAQRASVFYAPSMTVANALQGRPVSTSEEPRLLAFGHALPEAEAEVRRIAGLYPKGSLVRLNGEADEATFKADAPGYDVVHVAAHAQLDEWPMYSAVLLSDRAAEDGRLEAREIAALRLGARLVVISACETARGDHSTGGGVVGLPWALLATGARSSVVSLWSVDSTATAKLMEGLHRRLLANDFASVSDALRAAQLTLVKSDEYSHPYYWAPFVVVGGD